MKDEIKEIFELYEKQATNPDLAILIKTLKEWYFEKEEYKSRNEKAIEYLKENMKDSQLVFGINDINRLYTKNNNDLLNILEGKDK